MRVVNILFLFLLVVLSNIGAPYFSIRSQAVDSARQLAGWAPLVNRYDTNQFYVTFAIIPEFTQSFHPNNINECFFGRDIQECFDSHGLKISGSRVENRNRCQDWLADYFGLPTDFESFVAINPVIENAILDFSWYFGLDNWHNGLYLFFHFPLVHTRWDYCFKETIINAGTADFAAGYFSENEVPRENLLPSFTCFITGQQAPQIPEIEFEKLKNSKWPTNVLTITGVPMVEAAFGWNFIQNEDYHLGLQARAGAPAGNEPKGIFLFEPIIGNGGHWQVGGGISGHVALWRNACNNSYIGLYGEINITHLTRAKQCRTFDLCRRQNSRYVLTENINPPVQNLFSSRMEAIATEATSPGAQFKSKYTTAANLTKAKVNVTVGAQVDATFMLNFSHCDFNLDLGYNFWTKTCETISFSCEDKPLTPKQFKTWAVKGDAQVFGFASQTMGAVMENDPIALSATQTFANIHEGTNNFVGSDPDDGGDQENGIRPTRNPFVNNAEFAFFALDDNAQLLDRPTTENGEQIKTSNPPLFLSTNSIDLSGARTEGSSHKIFINISRIPVDDCLWTVYLGFGAKVEFSLKNPDDPDVASHNRFCSRCQNCVLDEWGVWLKGGFAYY